MVYMFMKGHNLPGLFFFSIGVATKMSGLLYLPAVYLITSKTEGIFMGTLYLGLCVAAQAVIAFPFMMHDPAQYFSYAFNFSREIGTSGAYNWRLVPDSFARGAVFKLFVFFMHVGLLLYFLLKKWIKFSGKYCLF
jgi:Gpi18-like mannosyltransferase